MLNIMSYVGMSLQAEVCLWTLLGLIRTIFDATLFKVNANLKQVWQMRMPPQLSMSVQRVLRTMVSGIMLVQCFTLYVYLAFYIVLLYPVFLEERPTLVLPWLLLAAIRRLLCELTSLALGLGTCVLLGPGRPACIRFLITKVLTIAPAFYVWLLVFSYYHALKMATAFKRFPTIVPPTDRDFGIELAVRRRRTKSLFDEDQLRRKIKAGLYAERVTIGKSHLKFNDTVVAVPSNDSNGDEEDETRIIRPESVISERTDDLGPCEDGVYSDVAIPRDTDRILEQFVSMSLRIATYLKRNGHTQSSKLLDSLSIIVRNRTFGLESNALSTEHSEPPQVVASKGKQASYLTDYPQIFMKKASDIKQSKVGTSDIGDKATQNKAVGSHDSISSKKSTTFREKSTFIEFPLCVSKISQSSHVFPVNDSKFVVKTQTSKDDDDSTSDVIKTEYLENIEKAENLSQDFTPNEDDKSQEDPGAARKPRRQSDA